MSDSSKEPYHHASVLYEESVEILDPGVGSVLVDCTMGGGGHTRLMLSKVGPTGLVIAIDRDREAIQNARMAFHQDISAGKLKLFHACFEDIFAILDQLNLQKKVQGILADIGVSSHHLDRPDRGFSFQLDGPLDMRMDQSTGLSAADFLSTASESDIANVIWKYGEEPKSRFIAKLICERRHDTPFKTTKQLADLIANKVSWKEKSRKHPATRTFQAIRIHINQELFQLERLLADAPKLLRPGGVLGIITFHSLEDRIVKQTMTGLLGKKKSETLPRDLPLTAAEIQILTKSNIELVKPFPVVPSEFEISKNPRSRSAKLRAMRIVEN